MHVELVRERPRELVLEDHLLAEEHDAHELARRACLSECPGKLFVGDESLPDQQLAEPWRFRVRRRRMKQRRPKLDGIVAEVIFVGLFGSGATSTGCKVVTL